MHSLQHCSIGFSSGDRGGQGSSVNSLTWSWNQFEATFVFVTLSIILLEVAMMFNCDHKGTDMASCSRTLPTLLQHQPELLGPWTLSDSWNLLYTEERNPAWSSAVVVHFPSSLTGLFTPGWFLLLTVVYDWISDHCSVWFNLSGRSRLTSVRNKAFFSCKWTLLTGCFCFRLHSE